MLIAPWVLAWAAFGVMGVVAGAMRYTAKLCALQAKRLVDQGAAAARDEGYRQGRADEAADQRSRIVQIHEDGLWTSMGAFQRAQPRWPVVWGSSVWRDDLKPAYQEMLWETLRSLVNEGDEERKRLLQVRAILIEQWLRQPEIAVRKLEGLLQNEFESGRLDAASLGGQTHGA